MPGAHVVIKRECRVERTPRVMQMEGMFDVPPSARSAQEWRVALDLPAAWNVGLIVGPSGSGKTTLAREVFGAAVVESWPWPHDKSLLDGFPAGMGIKDIVGLLSSVGFSSPPAWVRPYRVLSTGEQFRVHIARTLAEKPDLAVIDEFTSVVDRTVAKIGSAAIAKAVRKRGQKLVAVSCHYDVAEWLEPDWSYEVNTGTLSVGRRLQRPPIEMEIRRCDKRLWRVFKAHHYLSGDINKAAKCFLVTIEGQPAAFGAVNAFPHAVSPGWHEHRFVTLPDFQGVGIGNRLSEYVGSLFAATGKPYRGPTTHPAFVQHRLRSSLWRCIRRGQLSSGIGRRARPGRDKGLGSRLTQTVSTSRAVWSFQYVGPSNPADARAFGIL